MPTPSLQDQRGPSRHRPPMVPTNMHNITQVFRLAPRSLPIRHSPNQGHPHPHRGELSGLQLRLDLTRPTMLTWAQKRQGAFCQGRHRSLPRSQMTYEELLPSLIANHLDVVVPGKIYHSPFPKWYNPSATCTYHGGPRATRSNSAWP